MTKRIIIFVVLALFTASVSAATIAAAKSTDRIEVTYLAGIISFLEDWEKLMAKMHIYHGAIGCRNLDTGMNYTFEYWVDIPNEINAIFPTITNPGPTCDIVWQNNGLGSINDSIDPGVFGPSSGGIEVKVAEINGDQFNQFADWTLAYNQTRGKYYSLFNVVENIDGKVFVPQLTCWDYVVDAFKWLNNEFGVQFEQSEAVKEAFVDMIIHEDPPVADFNDPDTHAKICKFYESFQFSGRSIWWIIADIIGFGPEEKYVFNGYNYYGPLDFKWPWISLRWEAMDLPK